MATGVEGATALNANSTVKLDVSPLQVTMKGVKLRKRHDFAEDVRVLDGVPVDNSERLTPFSRKVCQYFISAGFALHNKIPGRENDYSHRCPSGPVLIESRVRKPQTF